MDRPTFSPSRLHFTATLQNDQMIEIWKVHALCPVFRLLHDTIVPPRHLVKLIVCVVLPRGPQGTGPRCANFWISTWCESPHWWIYYINGKRDPEREGTHKGVNNTGAQSARSCQWAYQLQDVLLPLEASDWNTFHRSGSLLDVQATAETVAQHQCVSEGIVRLKVLCLLCSVGCCIWVASFVPSISMMEPETLKFQNTHQTPENWWNAFEMAEFWCGQLTPCYVEPWYLCINKIKGNRAGLMA